MTTPPEQVTVQCPSCGVQFQAWHRATMEQDLAGFDSGYVEDVSSPTCPACGTTTPIDTLRIDDGIFHFPNE